ncbi:MAG: hypothetical protein WBQ26_03410 [Gemmatimonadaceae bacterium]
MTAVRRRIVGGLVAGLATATIVAWTPGRQLPQRESQPVVASSTPVPLDCTSCHPGVHATMSDTGPEASARCTTCHARAHEAIQALFTGQGPDSTLRPDQMYLARVGCRSCHTDRVLAATASGPRMAAIVQACTSCHGPSYRDMLPRWDEALGWRTQVVASYVSEANAQRRLAERADARAELQSARADMTLVVDGVGLHNVPGADALLRSAVRKVGSAYRDAGLPVPPPPALGPNPAVVPCAECHYGIEALGATIFGQAFSHADHVVRADVACSKCHSSAGPFAAGGRQFDPAHGKPKVTAAACSECHHVTSALTCATCHSGRDLTSRADSVILPLHLRPTGAPTSREVAFRHGAHATVQCARCHTSPAAIATVVACTTCHEAHHREAADCAGCHGTKLLTSHVAADHLACAQCHARTTLELLTGDRTFCLSCHVDQRAHQPARECAPCHMQMSPNEVQARILGRRP